VSPLAAALRTDSETRGFAISLSTSRKVTSPDPFSSLFLRRTIMACAVRQGWSIQTYFWTSATAWTGAIASDIAVIDLLDRPILLRPCVTVEATVIVLRRPSTLIPTADINTSHTDGCLRFMFNMEQTARASTCQTSPRPGGPVACQEVAHVAGGLLSVPSKLPPVS